MKIWRPDTCQCVIEEIYNGTEIVGGGKVVKKCLSHSSVADESLYGVIYSNADGENKRKNKMLRILLGHEEVKDIGLSEVKIKEDGSSSKQLKDGIEYKWSFSGEGAERVLNVEVVGAVIDPSKKSEILSSCEQKFGSAKVNII